MKRLILFISVLLLVSSGHSFAQNANEILNKVQQQFKVSKGVSASFSATSFDKKNKIIGKESGFISAKSNKYYVKKGDYEIFCNGNKVWNYNRKANEVTINSISASSKEINPMKLLDGSFIKQTNVKSITGSGRNYKIELTPKDKRENFFLVTLFISKSNYFVSAVQLLDKSGNNVQINFSGIKTNVSLPDSKFSFDVQKYPGIEVIE